MNMQLSGGVYIMHLDIDPQVFIECAHKPKYKYTQVNLNIPKCKIFVYKYIFIL